MNALNILIEQMAADISSQALRLDNVRLRLFLEWLNAHGSKVKAANEPEAQSLQPFQMDIAFIRREKMDEELTAGLKTWFESLLMKGMLGEYHLILGEIAWWRDLDEMRLKNVMDNS